MRRMMVAFIALMLLAVPAAHAVQPDEIMADPAKEARARELSREVGDEQEPQARGDPGVWSLSLPSNLPS